MPKEQDLPELSEDYVAERKKAVRPWAWSGLILALAGCAMLFATGFRSPIGYALFGVGLALEICGIVKGQRFHKAFIARHPI